jgi:aspartyl-tRNA(Asn)/glutamyl-tRNA(Gln) amidotransferase subunit C
MLKRAMAITRETVLHVARLARLELEGDEIERMQSDLGKILGYVEQLSELSTEGVPATAHVAAERAPLREDELLPGLGQELALAEAPRHGGGAFAVPGFVDE